MDVLGKTPFMWSGTFTVTLHRCANYRLPSRCLYPVHRTTQGLMHTKSHNKISHICQGTLKTMTNNRRWHTKPTSHDRHGRHIFISQGRTHWNLFMLSLEASRRSIQLASLWRRIVTLILIASVPIYCCWLLKCLCSLYTQLLGVCISKVITLWQQ